MGSWEGEIACWWNSKCDILWLKTVWEMLSFIDFMTGDAGCFIRSSICPFYSTNGELDSIGLRTWPCMVRHNKQYQPGVLPQQLEDGVKNKLQIWTVISPTLTDCKSQNCLHFTFKHACVCWFAASPILLGKLLQSLVPSTFICIILVLRYQFIHTLLYASIILFISIYHFLSGIWCEVEKNYPSIKKVHIPWYCRPYAGILEGSFRIKTPKRGPKESIIIFFRIMYRYIPNIIWSCFVANYIN